MKKINLILAIFFFTAFHASAYLVDAEQPLAQQRTALDTAWDGVEQELEEFEAAHQDGAELSTVLTSLLPAVTQLKTALLQYSSLKPFLEHWDAAEEDKYATDFLRSFLTRLQRAVQNITPTPQPLLDALQPALRSFPLDDQNTALLESDSRFIDVSDIIALMKTYEGKLKPLTEMMAAFDQNPIQALQHTPQVFLKQLHEALMPIADLFEQDLIEKVIRLNNQIDIVIELMNKPIVIGLKKVIIKLKLARLDLLQPEYTEDTAATNELLIKNMRIWQMVSRLAETSPISTDAMRTALEGALDFVSAKTESFRATRDPEILQELANKNEAVLGVFV